MSVTFHHGQRPWNVSERIWCSRTALLLAALAAAAIGIAVLLFMALRQPDLSRPPPRPSLVERSEPADFGGLARLMAVLERDLTAWQRLVTPEGFPEVHGDIVEQRRAPQRPAAAPEARSGASAGASPQSLALTLALLLGGVTLVAGLAALLLERLLLAPFRALRQAAGALAEGDLHAAIPGTERGDEAGALARALEGFRLAALAASASALPNPPLPLAEAARHLDATARMVERIAAETVAKALEASLAAETQPCIEVAQGVRDLARQVVAIRAASGAAILAIGEIETAVALAALSAARPRVLAVADAA